ncbi:unnamed protein product [Symbiodinium sp. KB8]|nr:unnamed protein product [Symbiodinium sp. KB8]
MCYKSPGWHAADLRILPENAVLFFSSNENAWWEILLDGRWCRHAPGPQYWTELSAEELQLLDAQTRNDEEVPGAGSRKSPCHHKFEVQFESSLPCG